MSKRDWRFYYFESHDPKLLEKWVLLRRIGREILTERAQLKLEWIVSYHTVFGGNAAKTSLHFSVSRKTLHKWLSRFDEKNLLTLEEQSRTPVRKRYWQVTLSEEGNIIALRKKNMEYGKKKLKVLYLREYGKTISTWKIERVIRKHKLYPDRRKHDMRVEKRANSKPKIRIHQVKEAIAGIRKFGFLWHIDAIIIWWYGQRRIIFTAIEDITKIAFARCYPTNSSAYAGLS